MPRPKGSKNKPKNAQALLDSVIAEYKKQGKTLSFDIKDIEDLTPEQKTEVAEAVSTNPDINIPNIFELEGEEGEEGKDTFTCGNCGKDLGEEVSPCPHCGQTLNWDE